MTRDAHELRLCPRCRVYCLAVAFETLPVESWPDSDVCGDCFESYVDECAQERRFDVIHGGACACVECCG